MTYGIQYLQLAGEEDPRTVTAPRVDIAPDVDQYFASIVRQAVAARQVEGRYITSGKLNLE